MNHLIWKYQFGVFCKRRFVRAPTIIACTCARTSRSGNFFYKQPASAPDARTDARQKPALSRSWWMVWGDPVNTGTAIMKHPPSCGGTGQEKLSGRMPASPGTSSGHFPAARAGGLLSAREMGRSDMYIGLLIIVAGVPRAFALKRLDEDQLQDSDHQELH